MKKIKKILVVLISLFLFVSCDTQGHASFQKNVLTPISDILQTGSGTYNIEGSITKIKRNDDSLMNIWIQNYNEKQQDDDAILVKSDKTFFNVGEFIKVTGKYEENNGLPQLIASSIGIQNGTDNYLHQPLEIEDEQWSLYSKKLLNRLVKVKNGILTSLSYHETSQNIFGQLQWQSLLIDVRAQADSVENTQKMMKALQNAKDKGVNVTLTGILEPNLDQSGYQILVLDENDIKISASIGDKSLQIYAINDFHGSVIANQNEAGIVKVGSFLKVKKEEEDAVLLNSGDLWQGSIESNLNHGELLTDCMNEIGFDAFTLGNHEFDWGADYIQRNRQRKSKDNYQTPFLAANIYNYDIDNKIALDYANLGNEYTIKTMDNGLKVGIIGVIGKDQITSISSQYADNYTFKDPTPIIKNLSDKLRVEQEVDVVLLDCHTNQESIKETSELGEDASGITSISTISNKRYVDAVFCAHSHYDETDYVNGVPFIQGSCNGKLISSVTLSVATNGNVTCEQYDNLNASSIAISKEDPTLRNLVDTYKENSDAVGKEVLGKISGSLNKSSTLVNLVCAAMASFAEQNHIDIDYAIANTGRANLSAGNVTYAQLYKALPFDNQIYILEVDGSDIRNELQYGNCMYRVNPNLLSNNRRYTIAVLDYLALHRNTNRDYNYFRSMTIIDFYKKTGYEIYNYRDLTADYLRQFNNTIDTSLFDSSNPHHDISKLTTVVNFTD